MGRLWEAPEEPVVKHALRPQPQFLGRLADHHQRAGPAILHRRQPPRGADPRRHMDVMAAGMHHRRFETFRRLTRSEEHTSELQSLMRISYAVFCLKKKKNIT